MKKVLIPLKLFIATIVIVSIYVACSKEYSYESGINGPPAEGSIVKDSAGGCQVTVAGTYYTGVAATDSNYITFQINVTKPGTYKISTANSLSDFYFADSGILASTGKQTLRLKAIGTPNVVGTTAFIVTFDTTSCSFTVDVKDGTTIIDALTKSDSAWQFQTSGTFYHGPMDTAFLYTDTSTGIKQFVMVGGKLPTEDTIFSARLSLPTGVIVPGQYPTNNMVPTQAGANFNFVSLNQPLTNPPTYTTLLVADPTTTQVMNVIVSSYDAASRIVQGTFFGTAKMANGNSAPITNGKFIAKLIP